EERAPWLKGGIAEHGLFFPEGGVVDLHGLEATLSCKLAERGVEVRTDVAVAQLLVSAKGISGVRLTSGEVVPADRVVNAAGAWAGELANGFVPPIASHRRHLVELDPGFDVDPMHPVCWNIETEIYFRPHGHLVLACPGDDTPHEPRLPEVDSRIV